MAVKNLDAYMLGIVLDASGAAKGIAALADADKKATKLDASFDKLGKSAVRGFADIKKAATDNAQKTQQALAAALASGQKNVGSLISEAKKAQVEFSALEKAEQKALKLTSGGFFSRMSARAGGVIPGLGHISNIIQGIPQVGNLFQSIISPITEAAEAGVQFNAFLETSQIAFENMLGNKDAAKAFMRDLRTFAGVSPFRTEGLVKTAQYMGAVGFKAKEVIPVLRDVGDAVAATGEISEESVQSVVRAMGKMRSEGRVTAETMESLANAGIPAWEMLGHAIGKSVEETRKLAEQGRLKGPAAMEALRAEMRARYGGMMDRLQNTYTGRQSAYEDVKQSAEAVAAEPIFKNLSRVYGAALQRTDLVDKLSGQLKAMLSPVGDMVGASAETLIGGNITAGVARGVNATVGLATKAVDDMGLATITETLRVFGVNSPAKTMIPVGEALPEGIYVGVQRGVATFTPLVGASLGGLVPGLQQGRGGGVLSSGVRTYDAIIEEAAAQYGVDANLIRAVIQRESHGRRRAVSPVGAKGLMQLMDGTGARYGVTNPFDARQNIFGGTHYLADLLKMFGGNERLALAGYNAGEGRGKSTTPEARLNTLISKNIDGVGDYVNTILSTRARLDKSLDELDGAVRDLAASTNWRLRGDKSPDEGRGRFADLSPADQLAVIRGLTGIGPRDYGSGGADLTGGVGMFVEKPGAADGVAAPVKMAKSLAGLYKLLDDTTLNLTPPLSALPPIVQSVDDVLGPLPPMVVDTDVAMKGAAVAAGSFADQVIGAGVKLESFGQTLIGSLSGIAGLAPGGQPGKKRGFFSKLLGFAAPLLSFVPGVGGVLSTLASIGSHAAGGDWGGVVTGIAGGFAQGGAFRSTPKAAPTPTPINLPVLGNLFHRPADLPKRALGGPVRRGRAYMVGELRPEVFTPNEDGWIHPDAEGFTGGARRRGHAGPGSVISRVLDQLELHADEVRQLHGAVRELHGKIGSMPADHVVTVGSRSQHAQTAIANAFMERANRDPKAIDWMTRRVNGL